MSPEQVTPISTRFDPGICMVSKASVRSLPIGVRGGGLNGGGTSWLWAQPGLG